MSCSVRSEVDSISTTLTTTTTFLEWCLPRGVSLLALMALMASSVGGAKPPLHAEHRMMMQDKAILHLNLMNTIGQCRTPRPVIIYPPASPNKHYLPRGTLLHRCSDQTGCCSVPGEVCRPDTMEPVEKVFFVNHFIHGQKLASGRLAPRLRPPKSNFTTVTETLAFVNHTSCRCIKMAPGAIEHDEIQAVVSRPVAVPLASISTGSIIYHLIALCALIAGLVLVFFLYRCMFQSPRHRHRQPA